MIRQDMAELGQRVLDVIFGRLCVFCGDAVPFRAKDGCCPACRKEIQGRGPLYFSGRELTQVKSLFPYEGAVRRGIHRYKLGGIADLGRYAARRLARMYREQGPEADLVTCVSSNHSNDRMYNQSELLARSFAREAGLPFLPLLKKKSGVKSQTACRGGRERMENAAEAYRWDGDPERVQGKRILILDDVITTGATLSACAKCLKQAGAAEVSAYTIAAALPSSPRPRLIYRRSGEPPQTATAPRIRYRALPGVAQDAADRLRGEQNAMIWRIDNE